MAKKVQSIEQPTQDISNSKIEAIKNLIFGENIQEYNHEFDTLKAETLDHKKVNRSDLGDLLIRLGENIKA
tara:strand:+ start:8143 stop:8355 length:213 start_codon:yes stop_codon:yes gene_type:complete